MLQRQRTKWFAILDHSLKLFHQIFTMSQKSKSAKCPPKLGIRYLAGFVQYRKTSDGDLLKRVDPVQSTSYEVAKLTDNKQQ